jgi:hypothetical protein
LRGVAAISGGVASLGFGSAVLTGRLLPTTVEINTLAIVLSLYGMATTVYGLAVLLQRRVLRGFAVMSAGAAMLGGGGLYLLKADLVSGVPMIGFGVAAVWVGAAIVADAGLFARLRRRWVHLITEPPAAQVEM